MTRYHDAQDLAFMDDNGGVAPVFATGDPTTRRAFQALIDSDGVFLSSKAAILPGACDGEATRESGGVFWVWTYLGWGSSGEPSTRMLVDASDYVDVVAPSVTASSIGLRHRVIVVDLWFYTAERLSGSGGVTYRLPAQHDAAGDRYDHEAFTSIPAPTPNNQPLTIGFASGDGDSGDLTSNNLGVVENGDHRFTFYVDSDSGNLKCEYECLNALYDEYHTVIVAKIFVSPQIGSG